MTDKAALKEDVKKLVRALLISAPLGLTVRQVEEDFQAVMGYRLPYQKLGYDSASELFRDMKDVVKPVWDRGQMKVMGICDDTTRHIQKMVMRQKIDTRKRGGTSKITAPPKNPSRRPVPVYNNSSFSTRQNSSYDSKPKQVKPVNKPVVPSHLQFEIKELLASFTNGIHGSNFPTLFNDEYGYMIDYNKLSFSSLQELFNCIPGIEVERLSSGGYKIFAKIQHNQPVLSRANVTEQKEPVINQDPVSNSKVETRNKQKRSDNFDDAFVKNIRTILSKNTNGLWANKLPYTYCKLTGIELKLSKYGFFSVIDLVSAMPDVITIERPNPTGDWLLFDARFHTPEPRPKEPRHRPNEIVVPNIPKLTFDQLKVKIREVLVMKPGIVVQQLESAYQEIFGEELALQDHGFMDVDTLIVMLPDVLHVVYKGRGRLHLYPSKNKSLGTVPEVYKPLYSKVPSDAIGSGVCYKYNDLPPLEEYIEVYVSNVTSPANLTLQLKNDELLQLETVMDELEEVYCSNVGEKYKMAESMIAINQVCAALYQQDHNWHRAIITGITNMDFVEVKYVDYGTVACVPKGLLRYLKSSMFHLPVQGYDAKLSFLKPVAETWTKPVQDRILQLCLDKALVALVTGIQERVLCVCLTDTSTEEDIHINDVLVSENFATFDTLMDKDKPYSEYSLMTGYGLDIPTLVYDNSTAMQEDGQEVIGSSSLTPPRLSLASPTGLDTQFNNLSIGPPMLEKVTGTEESPEFVEDVRIYPVVEELDDEELMEQMNREMGGDLDDLESNRFIMYLDLGNDRTIHLINHIGVPYLPSANLRTLIDVDAVTQVMQIKQLGIQSISLSREEYPDVFAELDEYEVTRGPADDQSDPSPYITLYPLEKIPSLVAVFEDQSSDLSSILTQVFEEFSAEDPYWKGETSPVEPHDETVSDDLDLLKIMLQVSERKRQKILIAMMEDGGNGLVDELTEIEQQIAFVKAKVKNMQIQTEEIERGVVNDLVSQGHASTMSIHTSSTSRHASVHDDQISNSDTRKNLTSPVSIKSEKILTLGDTCKKMNVVEPFKPCEDLESFNIPASTEFIPSASVTQKGTTYYSLAPQYPPSSHVNSATQIYTHHFRPCLQYPQSYGSQPQQVYAAQPQVNMIRPPPGLPPPPQGIQQAPQRGMHRPSWNPPHIQPTFNSHMQSSMPPPHIQPNVRPNMQPNVRPNMQPNVQPNLPCVQPGLQYMMQSQVNHSLNQNMYNFPAGQYYGNQHGHSYNNAYIGQSNPSTNTPFIGQPTAGVPFNYGNNWSTQH
ncbi:uncharacterized protein [Antedon mediterranea]|uniref:uncharacterized protein n=1 Tax=Antedon mediterranea TaxID=105859 RepID=UPI003AF9166C